MNINIDSLFAFKLNDHVKYPLHSEFWDKKPCIVLTEAGRITARYIEEIDKCPEGYRISYDVRWEYDDNNNNYTYTARIPENILMGNNPILSKEITRTIVHCH